MASTDAPMCNICNNKHGRGEKHVWAGVPKAEPAAPPPKAKATKPGPPAPAALTKPKVVKPATKLTKANGKAKAAKASKSAAKRDITPKKPKPKMALPPIYRHLPGSRISKLANLSEDERIARRLEQKREAVKRFREKQKEGAA